MQTCKINNYEILYPSKWDELTREQLLVIVRGFSLGLTDIEFRVKIVLNFLNLKVARRKPTYRSPDILHQLKVKDQKPLWASATQLAAMVNSLSYLTKLEETKDGKQVNTLDSKLTNNLIPVFSHRFKKYHGPEDRLFSLVFEEYLEADSHFMAYTKSNDTTDLDKLIAAMYRTGDKKYDSSTVTKQATKLRKLNPEIKVGILLFYQGCRKFLASNFPHVFSSSGGSKKGGFGELDLIDALTNDDVTKNTLVRRSMLYNVMVRLERAAIQAEEIKANNKPKS